ncbi:hypothetical protein [Burkholderia sp. MSMB1835]|uniref:hypothetical protein n=1 Tax=Burkholderia sp. MSMB1835 TaxID=1637876 RepID=UPI0012E3368D|nr:hypothetical protein [Burkholderia sp. MSMB1835]
MMNSPEKGIVNIIKINAVACVFGIILVAASRPNLVENYIAYGLSGAVCVYLVSRYVIESINLLSEKKIFASSSFYTGAGLLTATMSTFGVVGTVLFGEISGLSYISFVVIGGELGEYRKIILRERRGKL